MTESKNEILMLSTLSGGDFHYLEISALLRSFKIFSNVNKTQKQTSDVRKTVKKSAPPEINSSRKDIKTIYEMFTNLTGKLIPGVSPSQPLPTDPKERMWSLYWQHKTMLNYLK